MLDGQWYLGDTFVRLVEIVSCWEERTIPPGQDRALIEASLGKAGFVRMSSSQATTRFRRGSAVGGLDYNSEGLEVQLRVTSSRDGSISIKVGNWGFPFEPLLMKPRFRRLADRIASDIEEHGCLVVEPNEAEEVEVAIAETQNAARNIGLAALVGVVVYWLLWGV